MRARWVVLVFSSLCATQQAPAARAAGESNQIEFITFVAHDRGGVKCGLYTRERWLKKALIPVRASILGRRATCRFTGVESGTYAIGAFHDENSNGKLDRNFLGIPKEPYGLSNDARGRVSAPSFDAARFDYRGGPLLQHVRLR